LTFILNSSIIIKVMPRFGKDEIYICLIKVGFGKYNNRGNNKERIFVITITIKI